MANSYSVKTSTGGDSIRQRLSQNWGSDVNTDYLDLLKLPIRLSSGTDVIVIYKIGIGSNTTADLCNIRFFSETGGSTTTITNALYGLEYVPEVRPYSGVYYTTLAADTNYNLGFSCYHSGGASYTLETTNPRITVLEEQAADEKASSTGRDTTTSTSEQDKVTLTFTPSTTGDYLIMGSALVDCSNSSYSCNVFLDVDETNECGSIMELDNSSYRYPFFSMVKKNLDNTEHVIKIQYSSENAGNTVGIESAYIVAIRLT